jgi:sarcosine oxidase
VAERHEYVVVGAGVLGLSVARELARRGRDVVCLEQLEPGHERAGSKSRARILRAGYHDPFHVRLAMRTWRGWEQLEEESGRQLVVPSGLLSCGRRVDELLESMRQGGAKGEIVSAEEAAERFPGLSVTGRAVYEGAAGILLADEVLRALVHGDPFELLAGHVVTGISDGPDGVTIEAVRFGEPAGELTGGRAPASGGSGGAVGAGRSEEAASGSRTFECRAAILCAGAWSSDIARMAGLSVLADALWASLQQVVYVSLPEGRSERLPAVVCYGDSGISYGLPTPGEALYKLGLHDPTERSDPAEVPLVESSTDLALLAELAARLLPGAISTPVATERCFYDNTPDQDFVLDRVGRLVIGAGTSGHGFKFGPLIGELLADLAEGKSPAVPIERFSAGRPSMRAASLRGVHDTTGPS